MKTFVKNNMIFLLSFLVLLCFGLFNYTKEVERATWNNELIEKHKVMCQNGEINNDSYCESILKDFNQSTDFYYMYNEVSTFGYTPRITLFLVLFLVAPALYLPSKNLSSKVMTKKKFNETKSIILKSAYKSSLIIVGVCFILFVLCYLYLGTFAVTISNEAYANGVPNNLFLAYVIQYISLFIQSVVCINLGLLVLCKIRNFWGALGVTYILYWLIELILEVFIEGVLINNVLKISYLGRLCSLVNGFVMPIEAPCLICPLIIAIVTGLILYFKYHDYESFIMKKKFRG